MPKERIIAHLDMDAFFASIEERDRPHLAGLPIAVGADPNEGHGRGVVSTANYKAREYGIHSAMPISRAWRASQKAKSQGKPEVVFLPVNFEAYHRSSANIAGIISKYSASVEQASVDEFYFDLSNAGTFKKAEEVCKKIKEAIRKEEKLTCSIGLGPNKLISKMAAGINKPDGFLAVTQKQSQKFLEPMPIRTIPGIGPKTDALLHEKGVSTINDLKKLSKTELEEMLGKWGSAIYDRARGKDDSPIEEHREAKSIGEQNTFQEDTLDAMVIGEALKTYCQSVLVRFGRSGFASFRTITVTVRFTDFQTISVSKTFAPPFTVHDAKKLQVEALKLLLPFLDKRKNPQLKKIRLLGISLKGFDH